MSKILKNKSLKTYNTFALEVSTKLFLEVNSIEELQEAIRSEEYNNNRTLILGGGSNLLLTKDFDGLVLKNNIKGIKIIQDNESEVVLKVGSGVVWNDLVVFCVANQYGGIENLSLIPGTVGAAPMQNIGAYGVEIKDVFVELEALNLKTQQLEKFDRQQCEFGYRESIFKHAVKGQYFICNVSIKLQKKPILNMEYGAIRNTLSEMKIVNPSLKDLSNAIISIRKSKLPDPAKIGNSGSFFKNPIISIFNFEILKKQFPNIPSYHIDETKIKIPAAWLIDQAGWKGKTFGNVGVHKHQALVLVNYGEGNGMEIKKLAKKIQDSVFDKFAVSLHPEVNII